MRFSEISILDFALALMKAKAPGTCKVIVIVNSTPMATFETEEEATRFIRILSATCIAKFEIKRRK